MACLEHTCNQCDYIWHDNYMSSICPMCDCLDHSTWFDEPQDEERDDGGKAEELGGRKRFD